MTKALGVLCDKTSFHWALVSGPADASALEDVKAPKVPANVKDRAARLAWVHREVTMLLGWARPAAVYIVNPGRMGSQERHQVEGVVLSAASKESVDARLRTTEQVRVSFGVAKGKGAYDTLHELPEVAADTSKSKKDVHLFAIAALRDLGNR